MAHMSGTGTRLYKGATTHTDMTGEAMTDSGDHKRYRISDRTKRYWDDTHAFTVYVAGTPVVTGFTIEFPGGEIVFDASQGASAVTVTGAYFAIEKTYWLTGIEPEFSVMQKDLTNLNGDTAVRNVNVSGVNAKLSLEGVYEATTMFDKLGGRYIVVWSQSGTYDTNHIDSGKRWEFYANWESVKMPTKPLDIITESTSLVNDGPVYYRSD